MFEYILEQGNDLMKLALIEDCELLDRIVEANNENNETLQQPKGQRKAYMGHLTRISNAAYQLFDSLKSENEDLTADDSLTTSSRLFNLFNDHDQWLNYVETDLSSINRQNNEPLNGTGDADLECILAPPDSIILNHLAHSGSSYAHHNGSREEVEEGKDPEKNEDGYDRTGEEWNEWNAFEDRENAKRNGESPVRNHERDSSWDDDDSFVTKR
jgi:hypothetical protein